MYFRFPKNYNDYTNNRLKTYTSLHDFFHPSINNLIFNSTWWGSIEPSIKDFVKLSRLLFSRDNLRDREFLSAIVSRTIREGSLVDTMYQMFINELTDDELPILGLTTIQVDDFSYHNINPYNFNKNTPFNISFGLKVDTITLSEELPEIYTNISNNIIECDVSVYETTFHTIEAAIQKLKELSARTFGKLESNYRNYKWTTTSFVSRQFGFFNLFIAYTLNGKYCKVFSPTNQYLTNYNADKIYDVMLRNNFIPENGYTFKVTTTARSISISFTERINETNRQSLYKEFNYTTSVPDILKGKKKKDKEGTPIYIGMELEVSTEYTHKELIDFQKEVFFICKHDGSITGSKPVKTELVTRIGSIKWIKEQWAHFFNSVDYRKFDTSVNTNNGMHIHIGRECFDDDFHVRNFAWMINNPANTPFIVALSERGSLEAMRTYCGFSNIDNIKKTKSFKDIISFCTQHRGAVNFKGGFSAKTVELRIFKGIVSFASIMKNLEFLESMFEFSRSLRSYRKLNLQSYFEYVFKTPTNKYFALKRFLEEINYQDYIVTAQIKELVSNETDPEKIVKLLNNSDIELTNEHISMLNKGKKRLYILEDGKVKLIDYNSRLASLDKDLASRFFKTAKKA